MHAAVTPALELITAGIYVGQLILDAEALESMSDEEVAQVEKAIRRAGGRSELDSEGDLYIRDVDQSRPLRNYGHLGFGGAVIEDNDVLMQGGPHACIWLVRPADEADYPSGWSAQIVEHVAEDGDVRMGALIRDLWSLDRSLMRRVCDAAYFQRNKVELWSIVQAEVEAHAAA
jgi:hypothetical protein